MCGPIGPAHFKAAILLYLKAQQTLPIINVNHTISKPCTHNLEVALQEWKKLPTNVKGEYKFTSFISTNVIQIAKSNHWYQAVETLVKNQKMKHADYEFPNNSQEVMKLILRPVPIKTQQSKRKLAAKGKDADGIVAAAVSKKRRQRNLIGLIRRKMKT